jgi:hypothetical protein
MRGTSSHDNSGCRLCSGYLKAVWPDFLGAFLRSGWPRGPGKALKKVGGFAPHISEGPSRVPGAGQTSKMHPQKPGQTAFRYPGVRSLSPKFAARRRLSAAAWCDQKVSLHPKAAAHNKGEPLHSSPMVVTLCHATVLPGRKSGFRAGLWPDCYRESTEIGAGQNPARKSDLQPRSTIA